jgi:hypothetical protein
VSGCGWACTGLLGRVASSDGADSGRRRDNSHIRGGGAVASMAVLVDVVLW